jgi:hypothetical protein
MSEVETGRTEHEWRLFPGAAPPNPVLVGWQALLELPAHAIDGLWPLVERALLNPDDPENRNLVVLFCQQVTAEPVQVLAAVRSCDYLLRQAAAINVSAEDFAADLAALSGDNSAGLDLLTARYEDTRDALRQVILEDTLADHGNVLVGLDWRVDRVELSHRGASIDTPVMFLSLNYRDGEEIKRLPLQLTPRAFSSLREFCERFTE